MRADFKVVLDACVLANFGVCDLLLRLAEPPRLYLPVWSARILDETHRTHTTKLKKPWPAELADNFLKSKSSHHSRSSMCGQCVEAPHVATG